MGPVAITMQTVPSLPPMQLPAALAALVAAREQLSGSADSARVARVYTGDAQILDPSDPPWFELRRGRAAVQPILGVYAAGDRFIANDYAAEGNTGYITGVIRHAESDADAAYFAFGIEKSAGGSWQIANELVMEQPTLPFAQPITAQRILQVLDDAGIQRAVVHSAAFWLGSGRLRGSLEDEYAKVRAENDWVHDQAAHHPDRLVAFCGLNPLREYALRELARCAQLPQVKGMKLHFGNSRVDVRNAEHLARIKAFFRAANDSGLAIMAHLWTRDRDYGAAHSRVFLEEVLPVAPDITVQIAHMAGGGGFSHDDALGIFADAITAGDPRTKNVVFDFATDVNEQMTDERVALLAKRMRQIGLNRILFGADTPIAGRPAPLQAWATFRRRMPLTDAELRDIADNVAAYLK